MDAGILNSMETLHQLSNAKSRSITPENLTGEKGKGGMAVTGSGADAAIEAADVVFMSGEVSAVPKALDIAKRTNRGPYWSPYCYVAEPRSLL